MSKYILLTAIPLLLSGCSIDVKCKASQIVIGMSEEELIRVCGSTKRNHSSDGSTQWVYRGSEDLIVYTANGKVRSMQWSNW